MRACVEEKTGVDLVSERLADLHGMRTESGQEGRTGVERESTRTRTHGLRACGHRIRNRDQSGFGANPRIPSSYFGSVVESVITTQSLVGMLSQQSPLVKPASPLSVVHLLNIRLYFFFLKINTLLV